MTQKSIPRSEHPRPQMVREAWLNLNGPWQFEIDQSKSGKERGYAKADKTLSNTITVPFCPESRLSGIGHTDFISAVWYKREFTLPESWLSNRLLLHFGAVDYKTEVWVNGEFDGLHKGGYSSFSFDITDYLVVYVNVITVYAEDDVRSRQQPAGKQCLRYHSGGCDYTRTTGIWQTVWLESVPETYIKGFKLTPDPENECVHNHARFTMPLSVIKLWGPGQPELYDLKLTLVHENEGVVDTSGFYHDETDIYDVHDYEQDPAVFKSRYDEMINGVAPYETFPDRQNYGGQPYFVSKFGGIWWNPTQLSEEGWGYGEHPVSEADFLARYEGLN